VTKIFLNVAQNLINIIFSNFVIVIDFLWVKNKVLNSILVPCLYGFGHVTASIDCELSLWAGSEIPLFVRPSMAACNFFSFLFFLYKISCFSSSCSFKSFVIASNWSHFLQVAFGVWVCDIICSWSYISGGIMYNVWHFENCLLAFCA
jgi:hypothetical protein